MGAQYSPPQGVYLLFDDGKVVYVGQTNDIFRRISEHSRDGSKAFDNFKYLECDDEKTRLMIEYHLIQRYKPKYNEDYRNLSQSICSPFDIERNYKSKENVPELIEKILFKDCVA